MAPQAVIYTAKNQSSKKYIQIHPQSYEVRTLCGSFVPLSFAAKALRDSCGRRALIATQIHIL